MTEVNSLSQKTLPVWFPESDQSEEIKPAKSALEDTRSFVREHLPRLKRSIAVGLVSIISHNDKSSEPPPQTTEDVLNRLESMPLGQLSVYVEFEVEEMQKSITVVRSKRLKGFRKGATKFQDFAIAFSQFLKAYSGVVEILQGVDAQFGNVAFAALSLLYMTVKIKAEAEMSIYGCMRQISDRLPDLSVYQRICPDPNLGAKLAEAYRDVIVFARHVTIYYQGSGLLRYARSLGHPAKFRLMEQGLSDQFGRIRLKCEVLLAQKIDDMQRADRGFHEQSNVARVLTMGETLELDNYRTKDALKDLKEYSDILRDEFLNDRRRQKMDLGRFLRTPHGKDWNIPASMLMLLFGRNEVGSSTLHSWLSLIAVESIERLLELKEPVAYDLCRKSSTLEMGLSPYFSAPGEKTSIDQKPQGLPRDIIPDLTEGGTQTKNRGTSCSQYITTMLSLVKDARTELKILIVQRSEFWDFDENRGEVDDYGLELGRFRPVCMDQRTLL